MLHNYDDEEGPYPEETSQSQFLLAFYGPCPVYKYKLMLLATDSDLLSITCCRETLISKI